MLISAIRARRKFLEYLFIFLGLFLVLGFELNYFGGLLKSADSLGYEKFAAAPWKLIGDWHPPGVSFFLYLGSRLGLSFVSTFQVLSALLCFLLFRLLEEKTNRKWALLGTLFFLLDPVWMMLRITLWSEIPFVLCLTAIGYVLTLKSLRRPVKVSLVVILFLLATQVRLTGLFFLPALIPALGYEWQKNKKWKFERKPRYSKMYWS